ncbi:MAG TPA: sigma-70 family RNA polymerase sigma factor [Armatimonadaceae bacterium]|jgi:RNA polymerase sigma-70 factor (ECF subfamily)|nr:sigma-70 family RNA polymerase sigma factor [Armatimonadaceae bacterium]
MSTRDFEQMVLPHREALYGHALSLTRNADEAEDLVQETTLRALRGFESFRADGPIRAWLLTILRNLFINSYRSRARAPQSISLDALENPDPVMPSLPGPERQVLSKMENEALASAISRLPADYREVLVLSDVRGLTYQEISDRMGIPVGTVRSRLSRARNRVRRSLFSWRPDAQGSSKMASGSGRSPGHAGPSSLFPA